MRILFVCTGNVCRSPMAEAFLAHEAERRGLDLSVRSTGTHAWDGRAATFDGRRIMDERGVNMDAHRAARTTAEHIEWADLVIGMSVEHARETVREFPEAEPKTFLLKQLLELMPHLGPLDDPAAWVKEADSRRALAEATTAHDIDDPFGEREAAYRRVSDEIGHLIDRFADGLAEARTR